MARSRLSKCSCPQVLCPQRGASTAPTRGFSAYQTLLKSYISEGLRRDEAEADQCTIQKLSEALRRRGVKEKVLREAIAEAKVRRTD